MKKTLIAALAGVFLAFGAAAAEYPNHEVKLVIPFAPGGATDAVFRVTSSAAVPALGESIVPVNMGGIGGAKGSRFVLGAPADGYTLLGGHDFLFTTFYGGAAKFNYDAFEPVCLLTQTPSVLTARPGLPFSDLKGMFEYAKANPGKLAITYSPSSTGMVFFEKLFELGGVDKKLFRVVVINGSGAQMRALLGGTADLVMGDVPSSLQYAKDGKLVLMGVSADKRLDACPEVPTLKEMGIDFSYAINRGIFAPKGTGRAVIDKVAAAYKAGLESPETVKKVGDLGCLATFMGPDDLAAYMKGLDDLYKSVFTANQQ